MRNLSPIMTAALLAAAAPAAAQTSSATATGADGSTAAPARSSHAPATSHTQVAERLAGRGAGPPAVDAAPDPRVTAASKAADQAVIDDPTVRAMVNGSMSKPPSLAGSAPDLPAPVPAPSAAPPS